MNIRGVVLILVLFVSSVSYASIFGMQRGDLCESCTPVKTVSANYTVTDSDHIIEVSSGAAQRTVTLFACTAFFEGRQVIIMRNGAGNQVVLSPTGGDTVNGGASVNITSNLSGKTAVCNGLGNWIVF